MLELVATEASIALALASPRALDALSPAGAYRCRVASDEAMYVREPAAAEALLRDTGAVLAGDPDSLILDASDGWTVWTLAGDDRNEAFARLSGLRSDPGFRQGDVARLPVRVIAGHDRIHLFVPAMWGQTLRERILDSCREMGIAERSQAWTGEPAGGATGERR